MFAALLVVFLACGKTPTVPTDTGRPPITGPRVTFPDGFVVRVEVAADDATRAQGLMFRDQLPAGTGMLFFFPQDGHYAFWMKNCRIPLDIIWIDSGRVIRHIKPNVPPCPADPCPSYPPGVNARYVLEIGAGEAQVHGLKEGDVLRFDGMENVVIR